MGELDMDALMWFTVVSFSLMIGGTVIKYKQKGVPLKSFFTQEGLGILKGMAMFGAIIILFALSIVVFSEKSHADDLVIKSFAYAALEIGAEQTKATSPMCERRGVSDKLTSNGAIKLNLLYMTQDNISFDLYTGIRHHSCWMNVDDRQYDALMLNGELRWWF